jgi:hypothetical protein
MSAPLGLNVTNICSSDGQPSAARHCISSIYREIDDDLLELALINLGGAKIAPVHDLELDILADQPTQQVREVNENIGYVENARLQRLLP